MWKNIRAFLAIVILATVFMTALPWSQVNVYADDLEPRLTITAKDKTYPYNGEIQGPGDATYEDPNEIADMVTVEGLQSGDTLTSIIVDGQGRDVGDYDLTPSSAQVNGSDASEKYGDVIYFKGKLHITSSGKTYTVRFKVKNGSWNDGTKTDKTVTLSSNAGDTLKLSADQIPAVGSKPDAHYKEGSWDVTPDTKTVITSDTTYTYTYANDEPQPDKYTITFDTKGGEVDPKEAKTKGNGTIDLDKLPTPGWEGHVFTGWYTDLDLAGYAFDLVYVG